MSVLGLAVEKRLPDAVLGAVRADLVEDAVKVLPEAPLSTRTTEGRGKASIDAGEVGRKTWTMVQGGIVGAVLMIGRYGELSIGDWATFLEGAVESDLVKDREERIGLV